MTAHSEVNREGKSSNLAAGFPHPKLVRFPPSMTPNRTRLAEALRSTLLELEQSVGVASDDPAMLALKRIVLRRIADLELDQATDAETVAADETPRPVVSEGQAAK